MSTLPTTGANVVWVALPEITAVEAADILRRDLELQGFALERYRSEYDRLHDAVTEMAERFEARAGRLRFSNEPCDRILLALCETTAEDLRAAAKGKTP